jgi:hypothetical protein
VWATFRLAIPSVGIRHADGYPVFRLRDIPYGSAGRFEPTIERAAASSIALTADEMREIYC